MSDPKSLSISQAPRGSPHAFRAGRYRSLVESIDEGFCVVEVLFDANGNAFDYRFLETNPAFARQTGLGEAIGRRMRELAPQHEEHWFEKYGRVAMTGEPARFVLEARALGERWFDVYAYRVDQPKQRHVAVLFRDISERIRSERSARLLSEVSQDLLRIRREEDMAPAIGPKIEAHFRVSQCAFVELDFKRRVGHIKNGWHRPDVPSMAGTHAFDDLLIDEIWPKAQSGGALVVRDVSADERIVDARGFVELKIRSFLAIPLLREGGLPYLFLLCRTEPSEWTKEDLQLARELATRCWTRLEHLRADATMRASEERLRMIVENARDYAILAADLERRVTSWNPGAEHLLGYSEQEMIGRSADLIFTPEDIERSAPVEEATLALETGRAANERWHLRKDGSRFWGSGVMMAMHDDRGMVYGLLKIMRDQTEEQETRQALEASRKELIAALQATEQARAEAVAAGRAKDQFLAALSHELRTPLSPVLMIASEGAGNPALPPEVRADFDLVRRNIELEARLIDDLLDLTRIAQGKLPLAKVPLDLHERVRSAVETVQALATVKGIALEVKLAAPRSRVLGDAARLQQILMNLLNNAIKFTPAGGKVAIESVAGETPNEITIRITDTGIGLSAEEIAHAFEPFAQGSHAGENGSPMYGGLGLGLAIVEELTAKHGGRVTVASAGREQGATFSLVLPLASEAPATEIATQKGTPGVAARPRRVLLVEDHAHTRSALQRMLQRRGHFVVPAASRAEALAEAARHRFDLLLSDIGLPDGDGYELLGELRRLQPHLQGIALSGFGMESDVRRSTAAGFSMHLVKPVSVSKLDAVIEQLQRE